MNAEEMFKELDYKKICDTKSYLRYSTDGYYGNHIDFRIKEQEVRITSISGQANTSAKYTTINELKAIIKQIKELGWEIENGKK